MSGGAGGDPDGTDVFARLLALTERQREVVIRSLTAAQRREFDQRWLGGWAQAGQTPPPGDWRVWLIRAGRGFGKTRAGAEWISAVARATPGARIALVGATAEDARRVMVDGASGLRAVAHRYEPVTWRTHAGVVTFASGAQAFLYSAEAPEALRGPEHHAAWCDELGKWGRGGEAAWDNLCMGLRLGERPRVLVTTTPRPTPLMRRLMALPDLVETRGATRDNPHLPASFVAAVEGQYGGTRLGRQELEGEMIDDVPDALWSRELIEASRVATLPEVRRVVVGVDPPAGSAGGAADRAGDACGVVAVAKGRDDVAYVIEDASVQARDPEQWARAVADCAARHKADRVVAEANQGGAMVRSVLHAADAGLPVALVHASRGKAARAEPVALLYQRGRVRHAGAFPALEDQLAGLVAGGGYAGPGRSPDRADALVWAVSELMLGARGEAGVRAL